MSKVHAVSLRSLRDQFRLLIEFRNSDEHFEKINGNWKNIFNGLCIQSLNEEGMKTVGNRVNTRKHNHCLSTICPIGFFTSVLLVILSLFWFNRGFRNSRVTIPAAITPTTPSHHLFGPYSLKQVLECVDL